MQVMMQISAKSCNLSIFEGFDAIGLRDLKRQVGLRENSIGFGVLLVKKHVSDVVLLTFLEDEGCVLVATHVSCLFVRGVLLVSGLKQRRIKQ